MYTCTDSLVRCAFVYAPATIRACVARARAAVDARIASEAAEHEGAGRSLSALVGRQEGVDDIDSCSESEGPITRTSALTHDNKERPCTYAPSLEGAQPSERRRVAVLAPGGTEDFAPMLELAAGVCSLGDNAIVLCDKRFFTDVDALGMLVSCAHVSVCSRARPCEYVCTL